jgi:hypothetical protein
MLSASCDKADKANQTTTQDNSSTTTQPDITQEADSQNESTSTPSEDESTPIPSEDESNGLFSDISDYEIEDAGTYFDERFQFSVDYPGAWETFINDNPDTDSEDGDPQGGIYIYINSNKGDSIYVYGQDGKIGLPIYGENSEEFSTNDGTIGRIKYMWSEGRITLYLVFDEKFNGVLLDTDEMTFDENKQQILGILKSIKINIE